MSCAVADHVGKISVTDQTLSTNCQTTKGIEERLGSGHGGSGVEGVADVSERRSREQVGLSLDQEGLDCGTPSGRLEQHGFKDIGS